jgi:formylglycine-generating enzyme required for sulfatase activity
VAAAAMFLPVLAVAVTELAGVTHLFRLSPPEKIADQPGPAANTSFDAKESQEASAKQLGMQVEMTNSIGMRMRLIPPGKFTMGSSQEEIDYWLKRNAADWLKEKLLSEGPQHEVEITHPFYMGQTEVTLGQFRQFVKATGHKTQAEREGGASRLSPNGEWNMDANTNWLTPGFSQTDDHPVVCVSWNDAVEFCNWLSKQEGKKYRMPTEAEWEYSCRAGSKGRWSFGDDEGELVHYARIGSNSQGHTWPVAGLKENAWGLHDMHGNVWQWCQDYYHANYYMTSPPKDPPGPGAGIGRVFRGGSWYDTPLFCRSASRTDNYPGYRTSHTGFRVVLVVSPAAGVGTESGAKNKPSPPASAPSAEADRRAAEYVLSLDGMVKLHGEDKEIKAAADLPQDPFRLTLVDLHGNMQVTDAGLAVFKDCKNLKIIYLFYAGQVTDAGLAHFKNCKTITQLHLQGTAVTDAGLAYFKDSKIITDLYLDGSQITDTGLAHFKNCIDMTHLGLWNTEVTDMGLVQVKDYKNLWYLALNATKVTDAGLANLAGLHKLTVLWMYNTGITDLTPLQGMPMEDIRLTPKNITKGLDILREMKSLKTIGIDSNQSWPAAEFWERYDNGEFK